MRILQVMASAARVSGVAQAVMNYYRHICTDVTFDFLVYWDKGDTFRDEIISLGGRVFLTTEPSVRHLRSYWHEIDNFFAAHAPDYDAVQLHDLYLAPVIFALAKKHGVKVRIAHSHTNKLSEHALGVARNWLLYRSLPWLATDFWGASRWAGISAFGKRIAESDQFTVIRNAIEPNTFIFNTEDRTRIRAEFGIGENDFVLGHIGRFVPQKNHAFLLRVFAELKCQRPDSRLLLVGDGGSLRDAVIAQAARLGIEDSVILAGLRNDIGALLSAMDSFCLPSRFEGLGIVLIEAQANGLACVASNNVPPEAAILPSYRCLSLDNSPKTWAEALLASDSKRDLNAPQQVTEHGFDITYAAPALMEHYKRLVQR